MISCQNARALRKVIANVVRAVRQRDEVAPIEFRGIPSVAIVPIEWAEPVRKAIDASRRGTILSNEVLAAQLRKIVRELESSTEPRALQSLVGDIIERTYRIDEVHRKGFIGELIESVVATEHLDSEETA